MVLPTLSLPLSILSHLLLQLVLVLPLLPQLFIDSPSLHSFVYFDLLSFFFVCCLFFFFYIFFLSYFYITTFFFISIISSFHSSFLSSCFNRNSQFYK
ncbi:uncharacterized protein BX664DRAFT_324600 [Halteromyces radiatus]|uniref:uncharacterized protein n=1 Tax=Halteromyces radiatus TaxID=101107 RepID=UPI00221E86F0|nr:uncharacterized protein BX664DRAFT_324600 [Halteromyces radiatus]KAI8096684.1 hypothetical protein BX664DRAFT_324600 [Halteromyces radiatus]